MSKLIIIIAAMIMILTQSSSSAQAASLNPDLIVDADIVYRTVNGLDLRLNVYRMPGIENAVPVLLVHGGGWAMNDRYGHQNLSSMLAERGFVVFTIDYRLSDFCADITNPLCVGATAPEIVSDVRTAATWIRRNAAAYGARTDVLGGWGESAGASLAELVASPTLKKSRSLDAVVSFSGPAYLPYFNAGDPGYDATKSYIGCDYTVCPSSWSKYSPATKVNSGTAPMYIVNSQDEFIPIAGVQMLVDSMTSFGVYAELRVVPGTQHQPHSPELDQAGADFLHAKLD